MYYSQNVICVPMIKMMFRFLLLPMTTNVNLHYHVRSFHAERIDIHWERIFSVEQLYHLKSCQVSFL